MRKNNLWITALAFGLSLSAYGQQAEGGISSGMLQEIKQAYKGTPADKAIHNAIAGNDINKLAVNNDSKNNFDTYFSNKVNSKGITNQKSSGRCWLFTGLNVIRAQVIAKYNLPEFELSQNYNFFWDQLEKANLFLQGIIDTREKPINDKMVEWLFKNPIGAPVRSRPNSATVSVWVPLMNCGRTSAASAPMQRAKTSSSLLRLSSQTP